MCQCQFDGGGRRVGHREICHRGWPAWFRYGPAWKLGRPVRARARERAARHACGMVFYRKHYRRATPIPIARGSGGIVRCSRHDAPAGERVPEPARGNGLQDGCPGQPSASRISPRSVTRRTPAAAARTARAGTARTRRTATRRRATAVRRIERTAAARFRGSKRRHPRCGLHGLRIHRPCGAGQRGRAEQRGSPQQRVRIAAFAILCLLRALRFGHGWRVACGPRIVRDPAREQRVSPAAVARRARSRSAATRRSGTQPRTPPCRRQAAARAARGSGRSRVSRRRCPARSAPLHARPRATRISPGAQSQPCARIPSTTSCTYPASRSRNRS